MAPRGNVLFRSGDGEMFCVNRTVAKFSPVIARMFEDNFDPTNPNNNSPLTNICGDALHQVLEWIYEHRYDPVALAGRNEPLTYFLRWDVDFFQRMDRQMLYDVTVAAMFLGITTLFNVAFRYTLDKSSEEGVTHVLPKDHPCAFLQSFDALPILDSHPQSSQPGDKIIRVRKRKYTCIQSSRR